MTFLVSSLRSIFVSLLFAGMAIAQTPSSPPSPQASPDYSPSLDVSSMDKSVDPCVDFYKYSCGGWQKRNPIPADQTSWEVYGKLYQDNLQFLRGILEDAAKAQQRDAVTQKVGDYYTACMNEAAINRRGIAAIKPELDAIAALKSVHDLAPLSARLLLETPNANMFSAGSIQDP
ncbi:MAG: M13 family peptidase, partial [Acidobacteria bacterium]|nr:M13 family peptidase [Acidobacteriota bacterium]